MDIIGVMPTPPAIMTTPCAGADVAGERAVRAVDPDRLPGAQPVDRAGEVAGVADRELDATRQVRRRRDRERVLLAGDRAAQPQPGELAGGEVPFGVGAVACGEAHGGDGLALAADLGDDELGRRVEQRSPHPAVQQHGADRETQQHEDHLHRPLRDEVVEPEHVQRGRDEDRDGEQHVDPAPHLVALGDPARGPRRGRRA